jgi:hypothetical protein
MPKPAGLLRSQERWMAEHVGRLRARLGREPRRLWRRYLQNNPAFVQNVLTHQPRPTRATPGSSVVGSGITQGALR